MNNMIIIYKDMLYHLICKDIEINLIISQKSYKLDFVGYRYAIAHAIMEVINLRDNLYKPHRKGAA